MNVSPGTIVRIALLVLATVVLQLAVVTQITVLDVIPEGTSEGPAATRLVERIRALERPVAAGVTGPAAFLVDYRDSLASRLPYALETP